MAANAFGKSTIELWLIITQHVCGWCDAATKPIFIIPFCTSVDVASHFHIFVSPGGWRSGSKWVFWLLFFSIRVLLWMFCHSHSTKCFNLHWYEWNIFFIICGFRSCCSGNANDVIISIIFLWWRWWWWVQVWSMLGNNRTRKKIQKNMLRSHGSERWLWRRRRRKQRFIFIAVSLRWALEIERVVRCVFWNIDHFATLILCTTCRNSAQKLITPKIFMNHRKIPRIFRAQSPTHNVPCDE